jgi:hypothetical protein
MCLESKIILQIIFVIDQVFKINVDSQGFYFLKGISLLSFMVLVFNKMLFVTRTFFKERKSKFSFNQWVLLIQRFDFEYRTLKELNHLKDDFSSFHVILILIFKF